MKKESGNMVYFMLRVLRNPHLWIIAIITVLLILIHYHEILSGTNILTRMGSILGFGLTRNTVVRILFLIPVVYGTVKLGVGAGISLLVLVTVAMFPRVFFISPATREALFETCAVIVVGTLMVSLLYAWQKAKQRLVELEATQRQLNSYIQKLSLLHAISSLINQSLDLGHVMDPAIAKVSQLMDSPAAWLNLSGKNTDTLRLFASCGLIQTKDDDILRFSQVMDIKAIRQLSPVIVEDASLDPDPVSIALAGKGIVSLMVVPVISKGKGTGTLGIGFHTAHHYPPDEIVLLTTVAGQISMVIENSQLYQKERLAAAELRISEKNYRDIFENANDAIWVHDMNGKILAANNALCRLTGYEAGSLIGTDVSMMFPEYDLSKASKEAHERALQGEPDQPYEQRLVKKDGSEVILQIGTSLTNRGEGYLTFQHIARDITEKIRVQESLRLYAQKVSQAQETERKRIARELHDETLQALVVVSRHLYNLASGKSDLTARDIQGEVQKISEGIRHYSQELRPSILDDLGLIPALQWLASDLAKNYDIKVEVEITGNRRQLKQEAELGLFRITQEALTNVRRHSKATQSWIKVNFSDHIVRVIIQDNGQGFNIPSRVVDLTKSGKLGLTGMQERAQLLGGTFTIDTQPGIGTSLTVEIPV